MGYKVAVAGATGNVGREILNILHERDFPADEIFPLASEASLGCEVSYGEDDILTVQVLNNFDFKGVDRLVLSGQRGLGGACAARGGGRLRGDRQHLAFPYGSGRALGGARG